MRKNLRLPVEESVDLLKKEVGKEGLAAAVDVYADKPRPGTPALRGVRHASYIIFFREGGIGALDL